MAACILILIAMPWLEQLNELLTITSIANRMTQYINGADDLNLNWRLANMIQSLSCPFLAMVIYRKLHKVSEYDSYILLHIFFCIGAFTVPIVFSRFTNYTQLFVVVYVAYILSELQCRYSFKYALIIVLLFSQSLFYYERYRAFYPYESIFTLRKDIEREMLWYDYN